MNNDRRILRMQQVRQQSKEIASKVLHNIHKETEKQKEQTKITKQNEYLKWYKSLAEKDIAGNPESIFDLDHSLELRNNGEANPQHKRKQDLKTVNEVGNKPYPTYKQFRDDKEKKPLTRNSCEPVHGKRNLEKSIKKCNKRDHMKGTTSKDKNPSSAIISHRQDNVEQDNENEIPILSLSSSESGDISDEMVLSSSMSSSDLYEELKKEKRRKRNLNSKKNKQVKLSRTVIEIISTSPPVKDIANENSVEKFENPLRRFTQISDFIEQYSKSETVNKKLSDQKKPEPMTSNSLNEVNLENGVNKEIAAKENPSLQTLYNREPMKTKNLQSNNRVQFYDYLNKFETTYVPPVDVIQHPEILSEINAGHVADVDLRREELKRQEDNVLRQKCEQRSQKALEKDKIQRELNFLNAKLGTIENIMNRYTRSDIFSSAYMEKLENIKQGKMDEALDEILKRPYYITCPEVNIDSDTTKNNHDNGVKLKSVNVGTKTKKSTFKRKDESHSSDSCASIVLNHWDKDAEEIVEGDETDSSSSALSSYIENIIKLLRLRCKAKHGKGKIFEKKMRQYTELAECLLKTLGDYKKIQETKESESEVFEKRLQSCIKQFEETNDFIQEFIKERCKYPCEESKEDKSKPTTTSNFSEKIKREQAGSNPKVEIVLKLRHKNEEKNSKKPKSRNSGVRSCLINIPEVNQNRKSPKNKTKLKQVRLSSGDNISSSTSYLSPPNQIHTNLNKIVDNLKQSKDQETYKRLSKLTKCPEKKKTLAGVKAAKISQGARKQEEPKNEMNEIPLATYVKRLLGMAPNSIKCLDVSSSDAPTPNSIVHRASNNNEESDPNVLKNMDLVLQFLQNSFRENSNESLENTSRKSTLISSGIRTERIWMDLLRNEKELSLLHKSSASTVSSPAGISSCSEKSLRSILKKSPKSQDKRLNNEEIGYRDQIDTEKFTGSENRMLKDRIAKIEEQLEKVRKEKEKILEMPLLFNNGEDEEDYTEYLDLPSSKKSSKILTEETSKLRQDIRLDELEKISQEKNKATRVSHDSGISLSRPVTAQDSRGTPDTRTPEIINISINEENIIDSGHAESSKLQKSSMPTPTSSESEKTKKSKPPSSITRFSPQLKDIPPHELSTIAEVETPGTSILQKEKVTPRDAVDLNESKRVQQENELENKETMNKNPYDLIVVESFRKILEECSKNNSSEKLNLPHWNLPTFEEFLEEKQFQLLKDTNLSKLNTSKSSVSSISDSIQRILRDFHEKHPFPNFVDYFKDNRFPTFEEFLEKQKFIVDLNNDSIEEIERSREMCKKTTNDKGNLKITKTKNDKSEITKESKNDSNNDTLCSEEVTEADVLNRGERIDFKKTENEANTQSTSPSTSNSTSLPDIVAELLKRNISPHGFARFSDARKDIQLSQSKIDQSSEKIVDTEKDVDNGKNSKLISPEKKENSRVKKSVFNSELSSSDSMRSERIKDDFKAMGLEWVSVMLERSQISPSKRNQNSGRRISQLNEKSQQPKFNKVNDSKNQSNLKSSGTEGSSRHTAEPFNLKSFIKRQLEKQVNPTSSDILQSSSSTSESIISNFSIYFHESSPSVSARGHTVKQVHSAERQKASTPVSSSSTPNYSSKSEHSDRLFSIESQISSVRVNTPSDRRESS